MNSQLTIAENLKESIELKQRLLNTDSIITQVEKITNKIVETYRRDGKVLFCGNGGSAADAQHLAAEFSGRYYFDRPPLFAEALHVNTSYLTAVANDYSFKEVYARMVEAMGREGDCLVALSTSGNSENVLEALNRAKQKGVITIGFTGAGGGKMKTLCDYLIAVPSTNVPRIQECHMHLGHSICELVESEIFPK